MKPTDWVWYATYGSNLNYKRFLCYITGGRPVGSNKVNQGCRNKTIPSKSEPLTINHELFFAGNSATWGGGVAFVDPIENKNTKTFCRAYLITKSQFDDIFKQENDLQDDLSIDFTSFDQNKEITFNQNLWYPVILFLGNKNDIPVVTLTCTKPFRTITKPSEQYLKTLIKGLKEFSNLDNKSIIDYLIEKKGIGEFYTNVVLEDMF